MTDQSLTPARILDTAEDVLRRFGPAKTTVVDVARALGVSHGSVYRHFASKAALREAVAERWLERVAAPLAEITAGTGPAPDRLHRWLLTLITTKHGLMQADPEMFATYLALVREAGASVEAHVHHLTADLTRIVTDGATRGELTSADPAATARALFTATSYFHNPSTAYGWAAPDILDRFEEVWAILLRGLQPG